MVKKSISVLLAVVILLSVFTVLPVTMNAATSGDYEYEILDDGTAEITDYIGSGGKVNIPSTIDGHRVTSLGERLFQNDSVSITGISIPNSVTNIGNYTFAFCDSESFTEVTIPNSVKHIGNRSFYKCTYLNSVYISGSVTSIGTNPFVDCANLTSIRIDGSNKVYDSRNNCNAIIETATNTLIGGCNNTVIPNTVKRIAEYAFENSGITEVTVPNSVDSIGYDAFFGCKKLNTLTLSDSITSIEPFAFYSCESLRSVTIPKSVKSIEESTFGYCKSLEKVVISSSVKNIEKEAFYNCFGLKDIAFSDSVESIKSNAFFGCRGLTEITIPNSVQSIYYGAFGDTNISSVVIPETLIYISLNPFPYCDKLTEIQVEKNNPYYDSRDNCNAVIQTRTDSLLFGCKNTVIPDDVTDLREYSFFGISSLTCVEIPESVTSIDEQAYCDCENLSRVDIPLSVEQIGEYAFSECSRLTDVYYAGSKSEWENIRFQTGNFNLLNATIHYNSTAPVVPAMYCDGKKISGIDVNFDSSWFFNDSLYYSHEIARLCSQMLLEGYIGEKKKSDLLRSLNSLGFNNGNIETNLDAGRDQMNYFIASKTINNSGEEYQLVFVGCIGSWHEQWNSNFDPKGLNSDTDYANSDSSYDYNHYGFNDAKNYIYQRLWNYMDNKGLDYNNTKILLTGHSRGAATANLLAAQLIDTQTLVKRRNLFTYTFATPNCTSHPERENSRYNRIFNIVYPTDFVTKVLPAAWDFGRYGQTFSLPTKNNDKNNYQYFYNQMMGYYQKLNKATEGHTVFHKYPDEEANVYNVVKTFSDNVSGLDDYYDHKYYLNHMLFITPFEYFQCGLCPFVNGTEDKGEQDFAYFTMIEPMAGISILYKKFSWFFVGQETIPAKLDDVKLGRFGDAHKMETYCSFMMGLSSKEITDGKYRKGYKGSVNCPVDVEVIDKATGEVVGRIVNNVVDEEIAAKENSVVMTVDGDQKEYWLPSNGDYEVRLTGNDDGVMDYTLSEIDSDLGETERKNFYDVPLEKDHEYVCTAENADPESERELEDFTMTDSDDSEIDPDESFSADEAVEYTVTPVVEGSGSAEPVKVKSGDYASVSASPVRSEFIGWYQGNTLLSEEEVYRFRPTKDIALIAKFTEMAPLLRGDADGDDEIMVLDATCVQRNLAEIMTGAYFETAADADDDGEVTLMDATCIQLYLAQIADNKKIGKLIS